MGDFVQRVSDRYPLHWLVWENQPEVLEKELEANANVVDKELLDPRGRTPLHLAVSLARFDCCKILLKHGANSNAENRGNWTVLQEAVATGNSELVALILQYRDHQRSGARLSGIPQLLQQLREAPDFYIEMKWEFTSWVPLVSRVSPSDTYRVYKSGANVRIDTTLVGFDSMSWQRGSRSMIFKGQSDSATFLEINHDAHTVATETVAIVAEMSEEDMEALSPTDEAVEARLTSPVVTTFVDTEKIAFERNKSGFIPGWRSDKSETVSGYECKVFTAHNVEVVTKTRTEHLNEKDRKHAEGGMNLLQSFLGVGDNKEEEEDKDDLQDIRPPKKLSINDGGSDLRKRAGSNSHAPLIDEDVADAEPGEMDSFLHQPGFSSADPDPPVRSVSLPFHGAGVNGDVQNQLSPPSAGSSPNESNANNSAAVASAAAAAAAAAADSQEGGATASSCNTNPFSMTAEEYFDENFDKEARRDVGRSIEEQIKTQKFKATLWLSEDYPLQLKDQVLPIIDLMALNNAWFKKLRDFITLQLPSGFPVKIEIPLFHVMNARVTFSNIFAMDNPVEGVHMLEDVQGSVNCCVDEVCFEVPSGYRLSNALDPRSGVYGGPGLQGRLYDEEDAMLQYAIQQSLRESGMGSNEQVSVWEAISDAPPSVVKPPSLNPDRPPNPNIRSSSNLMDEEERLLQAAIEESMRMHKRQQAVDEGQLEALDDADVHVQIPTTVESISDQRSFLPRDEEEQLRLALQLSQRADDEERQRLQREEEELEMILALSLTEK